MFAAEAATGPRWCAGRSGWGRRRPGGVDRPVWAPVAIRGGVRGRRGGRSGGLVAWVDAFPWPGPWLGRGRESKKRRFLPFHAVVRRVRGSHGGARAFFGHGRLLQLARRAFFMGRRRGERVRCLQGAIRPPPSGAPRRRPAPRASPRRRRPRPAALGAVILGPHKPPLVPPTIHAAQHERAGRARIPSAADSTAVLPDQNTASGYSHPTRSRPQDSASSTVHRPRSRASRWPAGRRTDLCGAMSALALIASAPPPTPDVGGTPGKCLNLTRLGSQSLHDRLPHFSAYGDNIIVWARARLVVSSHSWTRSGLVGCRLSP